LTKEECQFAYRESIFKHELQDQFIITHIIFELKKVNDDYQFVTEYADIQKFLSEKKSDFDQLSPFEKLREISQIISDIRASKLPDYHTI
jgi:UDP-N-acetylmuramate dehydrogenase